MIKVDKKIKDDKYSGMEGVCHNEGMYNLSL
jgi:hypothetical protein